MNEARSPSWTPVRRGPIYCAPACGRGCTWAEYQAAVKGAEKLKKMMKGTGWEVRIHENLGWFYKVVSGPVMVMPSHPSKPGKFWCMIGSEPENPVGGNAAWTGNQPYCTDPNRAVRLALKPVREVIGRYNATLMAAEKAAGILAPKNFNFADPRLTVRMKRDSAGG